MDTPEVAVRRKNLLKWIRKNGTPAKEKSLFSQLKGSGSFGEKVARRLEADYGMGERYLDTSDAEPVSNEPASETAQLAGSMKLTCETAAELRLLSAYRLADEKGRVAYDSITDAIWNRLTADVRNKA